MFYVTHSEDVGRRPGFVLASHQGPGKLEARLSVSVYQGWKSKRDLKECTECHMAGGGSVFSLVPRHWGQMSVEHGVCLESLDRTERMVGGANVENFVTVK